MKRPQQFLVVRTENNQLHIAGLVVGNSMSVPVIFFVSHTQVCACLRYVQDPI
jgi:hypothetical protein